MCEGPDHSIFFTIGGICCLSLTVLKAFFAMIICTPFKYLLGIKVCNSYSNLIEAEISMLIASFVINRHAAQIVRLENRRID